MWNQWGEWEGVHKEKNRFGSNPLTESARPTTVSESGQHISTTQQACPLHEHPPTTFRSNQKILVSLLRRLSPDVFQQQVDLVKKRDPSHWKFSNLTEKSAIIQNARNDELLQLLPSNCTCLTAEQRQNIHRMAKMKMHSRDKKR